MQVLSLDRATALEARLLRKELLAMLDVREFSKTATFVNPSESLVAHQVSCDGCTMARDLDFCRDEALVGGEPDAPWPCAFCGAEHDRIAMEERLLADVEALVVAWATQDVKCVRCGAPARQRLRPALHLLRRLGVHRRPGRHPPQAPRLPQRRQVLPAAHAGRRRPGRV